MNTEDILAIFYVYVPTLSPLYYFYIHNIFLFIVLVVNFIALSEKKKNKETNVSSTIGQHLSSHRNKAVQNEAVFVYISHTKSL